MALQPYWIERGLRIGDADSDTATIDLVKGSGVPGGDGGSQDEARVGSLFFRTDTGDFYRKIAVANVPADWERISSDKANDIFLQASYDNTTNGAPADGDDLEDSIGFLDANQLDVITLTGVPKGSVDLSVFSGNTIQDNRNIKQALQDLENGIESVAGGSTDSLLGVTTAQTLGGVLVDDADQVEWEILLIDAGNPTAKKKLKLSAIHDGDASTDATMVDETKFAKLKVGNNFNAQVTAVISGTGATQEIALQVASSEPSGINVFVRRTQLP